MNLTGWTQLLIFSFFLLISYFDLLYLDKWFFQKQQPEVFCKILVLQILQISQKNTFDGVAGPKAQRPVTFLKRDSNTDVLLRNMWKF